jgi:hypothetical protein
MTPHPAPWKSRIVPATRYRTATRYRIVVRGRLDDELGATFQQMRVDAATGTTVLDGELVDQAQLAGLLERLRSLALELVSVEVLPR